MPLTVQIFEGAPQMFTISVICTTISRRKYFFTTKTPFCSVRNLLEFTPLKTTCHVALSKSANLRACSQTNQQINSIRQILFKKLDKKFPALYSTPSLYCRVHVSLPLVPASNFTYPIPAILFIFFQTNFDIILPTPPMSSSKVSPLACCVNFSSPLFVPHAPPILSSSI